MNLRGNIDTLTLLSIYAKKKELKIKKGKTKRQMCGQHPLDSELANERLETWRLGDWETGADLLPKATFSNLFFMHGR